MVNEIRDNCKDFRKVFIRFCINWFFENSIHFLGMIEVHSNTIISFT